MPTIVTWVKDNILFMIILSIISGFFTVAYISQRFYATSIADLTNAQNTAVAAKYVPYDSTNVLGSDVLNCIRNYAANSGGATPVTTFSVSVKTKVGATIIYNSTTGYAITDPVNVNYIDPTMPFKATLSKNSNKSTIGIIFIGQ